VSRVRHLLWLLALTGCGGCGSRVHEVRWPASAAVSLDTELAASAEGIAPLLPDGTRRSVDPELPPDAPDIHARARVFEGLWYAEIRLGEADDDAPLPLVLMLHGRGDRPRIPGGPFGRVPTPMRVLVPRGPLALGDGYAWARHSVTETNHHDELASDLVTMADRLARLIRHVRRTRPTAGTPIVTGFSQGAITAWTTALRHPEEVGLALPIAGWVPPAARPPFRPDGAAIVRSMHGTADPIVRIEPTRELVRLLTDAAMPVSLLEIDGVAHTVTPEMNARFEEWLEEALRERAPDLRGGLGEAGVDAESYDETPEPPDEDVSDDEAVPAPLPDDVLEDAPETEHPTEGGPSDGASLEGESGDDSEPAYPSDTPGVDRGERANDPEALPRDDEAPASPTAEDEAPPTAP